MKLLMITSEFPPGPGGIGRHAHQLASGLTQLDWEVCVLGLQDHAKKDEIETFNQNQSFKFISFEERKWNRLNFFRRMAQTKRVIAEYQPDIILVSGLYMIWLSAMLNLASKRPCIAIGHGFEFGMKDPFLQFMTKKSYEKMSGILCVSHYTKQRMMDRNIASKDSGVIPNGADSNIFVRLGEEEIPELKKSLQIGEGPNLLSVGRVCQRKGQDLVIQALPLILEKYPNTQYRIVGLPAEKELFVEIAESLGVEKNVHFLGALSDKEVMEYMNTCDIFLMTSRHASDGDFEGYGIAILEAALCGAPAIATGDSGLSEAVLNGQTGILVPDHDAAAIASSVCDLITDNKTRAEMGERARNRVLAENTWKQIVSQYDQYLRKFI